MDLWSIGPTGLSLWFCCSYVLRRNHDYQLNLHVTRQSISEYWLLMAAVYVVGRLLLHQLGQDGLHPADSASDCLMGQSSFCSY